MTSSRLLKLEKDNQTLLKTVEELRGAASQETVAKLSKVSQENQRLNHRVKYKTCIVSVIVGFIIEFRFADLDKLFFVMFLLFNNSKEK